MTMKAIIEKELCSPVSVNGYAEVPGPYYHIYGVDEQGNKTFYKTVDGDIKEAAREAERMLDLHLLEVAYKENPESFQSYSPYSYSLQSNLQLIPSEPISVEEIMEIV